MKALAFDPEARYPNALLLATSLTRYLDHRQSAPIPKSRSRFTGPIMALAVLASVFCLAFFGMNWFAVRPTVTPLAPVVINPDDPKPAQPAIVVQTPDKKAESAATTLIEPETKRIALKPVLEKDVSPAEFWNLPVVWVQGSSDMKIHRADGCPHLKRTPESRLKPMGDARSAVAQGYSPCKACLKLLSLELEKRSIP